MAPIIEKLQEILSPSRKRTKSQVPLSPAAEPSVTKLKVSGTPSPRLPTRSPKLPHPKSPKTPKLLGALSNLWGEAFTRSPPPTNTSIPTPSGYSADLPLLFQPYEPREGLTIGPLDNPSRFILDGSIAGGGIQGDVVLAKDTTSGARVAVKVTKNITSRKTAYESELQVYLALKDKPSPFCPEFIAHFTIEDNMFLVMEWFHEGRPLHEHIHGPVSSEIPRKLLPQVALGIISAVAHIHSQGFIHTDIKLTNVLYRILPKSPRNVDQEALRYEIWVVDFGLARRCGKDQLIQSDTTERAGTTVAPEVLLGLKFSLSLDSWAIGCLLAEICMEEPAPLFLDLPAPAATTTALVRKSLQEMVAVNGGMPSGFAWEARQKFPDFFDNDGNLKGVKAGSKPLTRRIPCVDERSAQLHDLVTRLLEFDPKHRTTPELALKHPYLLNFQEGSSDE